MAARVRVRIDDFEDGALPWVCASSGAPPDRLYRIRLIRTPMWTLLLLLLGPPALLAFPLACYYSRTVVIGYLPFADDAQERMRLARRHAFQLAGVTAAISLLLAINAIGYGQARLGWAALVGFVASVAWLWRAGQPRGSVGGRPEPGDRWVMLTSVSQEFAAACRQQLDAGRAARRAGRAQPVVESPAAARWAQR